MCIVHVYEPQTGQGRENPWLLTKPGRLERRSLRCLERVNVAVTGAYSDTQDLSAAAVYIASIAALR